MSKNSMDMCEGPIFKKIVVYTLPIIATGLLQLLFNAADLIVVGQYCGEKIHSCGRCHRFTDKSYNQPVFRSFRRRRRHCCSCTRRTRRQWRSKNGTHRYTHRTRIGNFPHICRNFLRRYIFAYDGYPRQCTCTIRNLY